MTALHDLPMTAIVLRDGYAVASETTADAGGYTPILLPAVHRVAAGDPLPPGTDAVAMPDAVALQGDRLEIQAQITPGEGVLPPQGDVRAGTVLLKAGARLRAIDVAVLSVAGIERVPIRAPRILLLRATANADAVLDAASAMIARVIAADGAELMRADEGARNDLTADMEHADADAIVVIGGSGNGAADRSVHALARVGRVEAHGIAIAPGETAAFGLIGSRPVLHSAWADRRSARHLAGARSADAGEARRIGGARTHVHGQAHPQACLQLGTDRGGSGANATERRRAHSFRLFAAVVARSGRWLDIDCRGQRRLSAGRGGRDKSVAMSDRSRVPPREQSEQDLIAAVRRAARQEQFLEVVSAEEARARFAQHLDLTPMPAETVALGAALGRVLADDVLAPIDVPPFDRANVDGFALRAADVAGATDTDPRRLTLNREVIVCGHAPKLGGRCRAPRPRSPPAAWCRAAPMPS